MATKAFGVTVKRDRNDGDPLEMFLVRADSSCAAICRVLLKAEYVRSVTVEDLGVAAGDAFWGRLAAFQTRMANELTSAGVTKARLDQWL